MRASLEYAIWNSLILGSDAEDSAHLVIYWEHSGKPNGLPLDSSGNWITSSAGIFLLYDDKSFTSYTYAQVPPFGVVEAGDSIRRKVQR